MLVWNAISSIVLMIFATFWLDVLDRRHRRHHVAERAGSTRVHARVDFGHQLAAALRVLRVLARHRRHLFHRRRRLFERRRLLGRALRQRLRRAATWPAATTV